MAAQSSSSGWETDLEYGAGAFPSNTAATSTKFRNRFRNQKTITIVLSPPRDPNHTSRPSLNADRRNTMPSSGSSGLLAGGRDPEPRLVRDYSFDSTSSIYSHGSRNSIHGFRSNYPADPSADVSDVTAQPEIGPEFLELPRKANFTTSSTAASGTQESETSTRRSMFLSPSTERDVSRALQTLGTGSVHDRRASFGAVSSTDPATVHHIRSFYNADAVDSA